jgi:DNA-binding NarL/FixJ family response regulator
MKITIVSKNTFFQHALASMLVQENMTVAGQFDDLTALMKGQGSCTADVDVLIIEDAAPCTKRLFADLAILHRRKPFLKSLLVVSQVDAAFLSALFEAGCAGCLLSNIPPSAMSHYIRLAASGQRVLPDGAADMLRQLLQEVRPSANVKELLSKLTQREGRVLGHLLKGSPNKLIASDLQLPITTVKGDLKSIMRKTGAANRTALAVSVAKQGLGEALHSATL